MQRRLMGRLILTAALSVGAGAIAACGGGDGDKAGRPKPRWRR